MFIEDPKPVAFTNESGVFFFNIFFERLLETTCASINWSPFERNSIWNANFLPGLISKGKEKQKSVTYMAHTSSIISMVINKLNVIIC